MDMTSRNFDDRSINLMDSKILAAETPQKGNLHQDKSMKSDDHEDLMKSTEK